MRSAAISSLSLRMNSRAGISLPWARSAARMKLTVVTPGMAVGYWKQRNRPRRARASAGSASRASPPKGAVPAATGDLGWALSGEASVLLPEPLGPISAWTSPAGTVRSTPRRISLSSTDTVRPRTTRSAAWPVLTSGMWGLRVGLGRRHGLQQGLVVDQLGERGLAEDCVDALLEPLPETTRGTLALAGAASRLVVAGDAFDGRDLALDSVDDLEHRDQLGGTGQRVAAVDAPGALDQAAAAQLAGQLLEVGERQVLDPRHLGDAERALSVGAGELGHHPQAVVGLGADAHRERRARRGGARRFWGCLRNSDLHGQDYTPAPSPTGHRMCGDGRRPGVRRGQGFAGVCLAPNSPSASSPLRRPLQKLAHPRTPPVPGGQLRGI